MGKLTFPKYLFFDVSLCLQITYSKGEICAIAPKICEVVIFYLPIWVIVTDLNERKNLVNMQMLLTALFYSYHQWFSIQEEFKVNILVFGPTRFFKIHDCEPGS